MCEHSMNTNKTEPEGSILMISALNRQLDLGTLYNVRNDQLIPGSSLWKDEDIQRKTVIKAQPSTEFKTQASETLRDKMNLLDVSASVKASFLGGLIEVGGSAKYLSKKTSSTRQCSISLKYRVTTESKELMITELGDPNPKVFEKTEATHVVSQVLYGANAIMEFQETANDASSKQEMKGNLNMMIKKIPATTISGEGSIEMNDEDKEMAKNMSCTFYGDFHLQNIPYTYEDALKTYRELPSLMKKEKTVPLMVWLTPLPGKKSMVKTMNLDVQTIEKAMDDFHQAKIRTSDLLKSSKKIKAEDIVHKLEQFQTSLQAFTDNFKHTFRELIPDIREGKKTNKDLAYLLKSQDDSGFSENEMDNWLEGKETEISILTKYINNSESEIKSPGSELKSFLMGPDVTNAFVLYFPSLMYEEPYLKKISHKFRSTPEQNSALEEDLWYMRKEDNNALRSSFRFFNKAPLKNKVISFISGDSKYPPNSTGTSVNWHRGADTPVTIACDLTLDCNSLSGYLVLSDQYRKVMHAGDWHDYSPHPARFNYYAQVQSREPLPGRCYWECEWSGYYVNVGVAYKSMGRGEWFGKSAKGWCLELTTDEYKACFNSYNVHVHVEPAGSRRVGVYLDRKAGTLSFYRVSCDALTHLHTFRSTFTGEPLHAVFWVEEGSSVSLI